MLYNISCFDFKTIVIVIVYCSKLVEGSLYVGVVCYRREQALMVMSSCSQQSLCAVRCDAGYRLYGAADSGICIVINDVAVVSG